MSQAKKVFKELLEKWKLDFPAGSTEPVAVMANDPISHYFVFWMAAQANALVHRKQITKKDYFEIVEEALFW